MAYFVTSDGVHLHFTDQGTGTPILCLAGLTRSGVDFDYVAPHLNGFRVITMDYRGRGRSDWADPATYSIEREGRDALELLDHLGLDQAAILGTSRGGLIAMALAATAKDRLLGVALNDIGPVLTQDGIDGIMAYLGKQPSAKTFDDMVAARKAMLMGFDDVPDARWHQEVRNQFRQTPQGLTLSYDPKLRDAVLANIEDAAGDIWPFFDAMDGLPLALIRGVGSNILALDTAQAMAQRRPGMIWAEVPGRGHVPFLDEAESLTALHQWLETLP